MKDLNNYIKLFGNMTFSEKEFTEVDNIIFSILTYIPFDGVVPSFKGGTISIQEAFSCLYDLPSFVNPKDSAFVRKAKKMFAKIATTNRYKDLRLFNYKYELGEDRQFGAICIKLLDDLMYVAFKGTDDYVSGWEEDFRMACCFPVPSQKLAIEYMRKVVKVIGPKVIVGGHSKGGNLALVGASGLGYLKSKKIIKVYSNDGPGLREKEMKSKGYLRIKERLVNIIPNSSLVGILLKKDNFYVVKSHSIGLFQHDAFNWEIDGDHFVRLEQSKKSKRMMTSIERWLESYSDDERFLLVDSMFQIFKDAKLTDFRELTGEKWLEVLKTTKKMDVNTKKLLKTSALLLFNELRDKEKEKI